MHHASYLIVDPGPLVGKLLDLCDGHDVIHTSANVPSHMLSIVRYTDADKHQQ